jgi:hypothetical protein
MNKSTFIFVYIFFLTSLGFSQADTSFAVGKIGKCDTFDIRHYKSGKEKYTIGCGYDFDTSSTLLFYSVTEYVNGKKHGKDFGDYRWSDLPTWDITKGNRTTTYSSAGSRYFGKWKNGKKHGLWVYYDVRGKIIREEKWKNGVKIKTSEIAQK